MGGPRTPKGARSPAGVGGAGMGRAPGEVAFPPRRALPLRFLSEDVPEEWHCL